ncbi:MAG TPA: YSC84-related protein [Chitinophagaceae bacterium]
MKKGIVLRAFKSVIVLASLVMSSSAIGQSTGKDRKLVRESNEAKEDFIDTDGLMKNLFANAYGYVIFPNVGKGGIGIGGAAGKGVVYRGGSVIGKAQLTQVSIGFQFGGQAYREVIFFETKADLDRFKENKIEFSAQASAVAVTAGASANVKYKEGVMIFTQQKGGLMYEASVGGQKFNYSPF